MEELNLICDWNDLDKMNAKSPGPEAVIISIYGDDEMAEILFHKEKAAKLRDWLNKFLGDA